MLKDATIRAMTRKITISTMAQISSLGFKNTKVGIAIPRATRRRKMDKINFLAFISSKS